MCFSVNRDLEKRLLYFGLIFSFTEIPGCFTISLAGKEEEITVGFWCCSVRGLRLLRLRSGWQALRSHPGRVHPLIGEGTMVLQAMLWLCPLVGEGSLDQLFRVLGHRWMELTLH